MIKHTLLITTLLLAGCGSFTRSDYQRPLLSVPQTWEQKAGQDKARRLAAGESWWQGFDDPRLTSTISQVLQTNNDLAAAAITLKIARATAGLSNTNLTPDVTLGASASNSKSVRTGQAPQESYNTSLSLNYELDLWGKLARTREQSEWQVQASEQDYQATVLSTIGTTAQLYWTIALNNQQISNLKKSQQIARQTLEQVESWYRAGKVGQLDVLQSRQTLIARQNQLRAQLQQRENSRNALALLLNRPAEQHTNEATTLAVGKRVPIASRTPLWVIARRPDVQAAEYRLRAALSGYDVSRLSFYPTLSLSAALNAGSQVFSQWFSAPVRTLGASVAAPFIQWNTVQLTIAQAGLQVQQAAVTFRRTAYTALSEVDNAMEARLSADEQRERLQTSLALSQQRLKLTQSRYRAGAVDYQTLLNAQDDLLLQENSLAQAQYDYLYATMQLWLAQGGGEVKQGIDSNASK
ncbi:MULTISPECIES: TolC family protein [Tenebrionibacter/Tenebrionicola group]|jgi:NodT family efflux transporter outer membrane factor (OMF) lipoprotein|uniref:TolC family protein n=2 Tax=Tenebrionibacter/Tenebrionicola group TaxID=2969848 RepID=A0A8K0V3R4_9ENTR|nr:MULTISPECIES: TolC family protein [Tenebrionibacter/Tenebrionicola group]MBK4715086.1 TolC family protein [Tenebrionibacter intestinalis]MBV5096254.1 TolC family protein [Tenebrionicola larvae]